MSSYLFFSMQQFPCCLCACLCLFDADSKDRQIKWRSSKDGVKSIVSCVKYRATMANCTRDSVEEVQGETISVFNHLGYIIVVQHY